MNCEEFFKRLRQSIEWHILDLHDELSATEVENWADDELDNLIDKLTDLAFDHSKENNGNI